MPSPQDDDVQASSTNIISDATPNEGMDTEVEPTELTLSANDVQPLPRDAHVGEATTEETAMEHGSADDRTIDDEESLEDMTTILGKETKMNTLRTTLNRTKNLKLENSYEPQQERKRSRTRVSQIKKEKV